MLYKILRLHTSTVQLMFSGVSMVLTAISVFFIWLVSSPTGSIVMSCVFAGVTIVTWDAIALVTVEMFPSKVR